jgi:hypothetical protein
MTVAVPRDLIWGRSGNARVPPVICEECPRPIFVLLIKYTRPAPEILLHDGSLFHANLTDNWS